MNSNNLTDLDPMPFGEHKGKPMMNVPSSYLDWLRGQKWIDKHPQVRDYIDRSWKAIQQDLKRKERG